MTPAKLAELRAEAARIKDPKWRQAIGLLLDEIDRAHAEKRIDALEGQAEYSELRKEFVAVNKQLAALQVERDFEHKERLRLDALRADLVWERDKAREQLAAVTRAKDEACDKLESWIVAMKSPADRELGYADIKRMRSVGKEPE